MKRLIVLLLTVTILGAVVAGSAPAQLPEHAHILLLGLEFDETGEPVGFRKCVDLAGGNALPLHAHHAHLHFGKTGEKLFTKAGHAVVPVAPFPGVPWSNCEEFIEIVLGGG